MLGICTLSVFAVSSAPASAVEGFVATPSPVAKPLLDRALELAGAAGSSVNQLAPVFLDQGTSTLAYSAYLLPDLGKTVVIAHQIDRQASTDSAALLVLEGTTPGATTGAAYLLESPDGAAPVVEAAEFSVAAAGPGAAICGAGATGAWYAAVRVIGIGSGLVGSIVSGFLGGYICSTANSPSPFGDTMTLANYTGPHLNEYYTVWTSPGVDYVVTGGYKLTSKGCVANPSRPTTECWRLNSSGFYRSSVLFEVQIFWPDGSYQRFTQGTTENVTYGSYYATFLKRSPAHGNYVTGFALAEYDLVGGITPATGTGAARHTVTIPT